MPALGKALVPALFLAGLTAAAGAQQKACEIDEGSPNQVARAVLNAQIAQQSLASKPADAMAKLKDAVKMLNDGDKTKNPTGRAYELGRILVFETQADTTLIHGTTRGAVGFVDNPTAPYDIIGGIDSSFTVVETAMPECASTTGPWRQQKIWVDLVNGAANAANAGKLDSAAYYAKRSLQLSRTSPYAYAILAEVAKSNNQPKEVISEYKQAIANAKDTAVADNRRQWLYQLGSYAADMAEQDSANKAIYVPEAKAAFDQLAKDPGTKFADAARSGQARVAMLSGDTQSIKASYAEQLANPGAFSYNSLMMAAVTAAKSNQNADALKLFEAARKANPYHRDVLYNVSRLYLLDSAYTPGIEAVRQLIAVDPSNPDNYQLMAIAYASQQKLYQMKEKALRDSSATLGKIANTSKNAAAVKAAINAAAKLDKPIKAYADSGKVMVDSALKYNDLMMKMPAKVTFSEFTAGDAKTTLGGTIMNQTDAAKSFTMKIDFLDKSGNVVNTQTVNVGPIEAHRSAPFKAEGVGAGIVAFRYAPLS
jgi:tetratricopeptide (TPR) repeat protein